MYERVPYTASGSRGSQEPIEILSRLDDKATFLSIVDQENENENIA